MWFGDLGGLGAGLEGHEYAPGGSGGSLTSHTPPWRHYPTQIQTQIQTQTQKQTQTQTHTHKHTHTHGFTFEFAANSMLTVIRFCDFFQLEP